MSKKSFLAMVFAACFAQGALAQESDNSMKPDAGSITAEINLNLFNLGLFHGSGASSGNPFSLNNGMNQIRGRYFLSSSMAIRAGLNISASNTRDNFAENPDGSGATGTAKQSSMGISLMPGFEKHFAGTNRLSTYVGADLLIGIRSASQKTENSDGSAYVKDLSIDYKGGWANGGARGGFDFGVRGVAGADFYFIPNVYLGAEFGWGFVASKASKIERTTKDASGTNTVVTSQGASSFNLTPSVLTGIRLGYKF